MKLRYKRVHRDAQPPIFASEDAACFDLYAVQKSGNVYHTGLAFDIPKGYCLEVYSRSGHGFKDNTRLANCVGIVDSDYTGEVLVKLTRDDGKPAMPMAGERVAQAKLRRLVKTELEETDTLKDTERGENGFGSTGR